ncbi:MAG: flagellar motor protein MotB [Desulfobacterales bacterium]
MSESDKIVVRKVKKRGGHEGHHGGAWKVAYADFVTAMMALFIVLWIIAHNAAIRESVALYFRDPGAVHKTASGVMNGVNGIRPFTDSKIHVPPIQSESADEEKKREAEVLREEGERLKEAIAALPDLARFKDQIQITLTKEGLRIELIEQSEGLFFDIGSARLKPDAVALLRLIASRIGQVPNEVVIEGHTDSRPYAGAGYNNWDLSTDRANAARRVLENGGVRDRQITSVNGYADRRLKNPARPFDYSNRRVTILVAFGAAGREGTHAAAGSPEPPRRGPEKPLGKS